MSRIDHGCRSANRRLDVVRLHNWTDEHCWSLRYHLTMHVTTILNIKLQYELQFYPPVIKSMEWKTLYLSMGFPTYTSMFGGILGCHMWFFQRVSFVFPGMWNWMCHKVDPPITQSQEGTEVKLAFRRIPLKNILQLLSMTYITWWEAPRFRLKLPKPTRWSF